MKDDLDNKINRFDDRLDSLETSQAEQDEKLLSIRETTLSRCKDLEKKLPQLIREIVDIRIELFQESLKKIEILVSQVLNRLKP